MVEGDFMEQFLKEIMDKAKEARSEEDLISFQKYVDYFLLYNDYYIFKKRLEGIRENSTGESLALINETIVSMEINLTEFFKSELNLDKDVKITEEEILENIACRLGVKITNLEFVKNDEKGRSK